MPCNCDVDGGYLEPAWLGTTSLPDIGTPLLVEPDESTPSHEEGIWAHIDPSGSYPDPLPVDVPVEVTGQFDHPAAQTCRSADGVDEEFRVDEPVVHCRTTFAVISLEVAAP